MVWQGSAGNRRPYANQVAQCLLTMKGNLGIYEAVESGAFQERCPNCGRHVNGDKSIGRKQVVFTAFVDDTNIAVPRGLCVRQHSVDFVAFKRSFIPAVADTDGEPSTRNARPSRDTSCA